MTLTNLDERVPVLDTSKLPVILDPQTAKRAKAQARLSRRVEKRKFVTIDQQELARQHLDPLPGPHESIHGVIGANYSGWDLALAAIELIGVPIEEMLIATLGFNRPNCESLVDLLDTGRVRNVVLLASDYFRSADRRIFADIRRDLESRGQRVAIGRSHAKLIMLRAGKRHIVIETSANLRSSVNVEQFVVNDDKQLFNFHRRWIHKLLERKP